MSVIQNIPYLDGGRDLCVTGACLLTASADPLGRAIRCFEGENAFCSHAAPVVRYPEEMVRRERVTLIEALGRGLTPTYLSHYFKGFRGDLYLFVPEGLTPEKQEAFRFYLMDKMFEQTEYDYHGLVKQIRGRVKEEASKMFCSEAYGFALEYANIQRLPTALAGFAPQPPDIVSWWAGTTYKLLAPFSG